MILRRKCDSVDSNFTDEEVREVFVCAEQKEDGSVELYEQYGGVDKEGPHAITRKVTVDRDFIKNLSEALDV